VTATTSDPRLPDPTEPGMSDRGPGDDGAGPDLAGPGGAPSTWTSVVPTAGGWEVVAGRHGAPLELSELLPVAAAFGFRIVEAVATHDDDTTTQRLRVAATGTPTDTTATRLGDALAAAMAGDGAVDGLLALLSTTPLTWVEVDVLRAARRMLQLLGSRWPRVAVERALVDNPAAATALWSLFRARLDPAADPAAEETAAADLADARGRTASLTEDRVLADLAGVVRACVRTNAFAPLRSVVLDDGRAVPFLACKFESAALPEVPAPVPHAEVLVTSPVTTGVHLRAGAIARGGLRASDRWDVRNEVLDLMAAQVVKNSVIVPTGAKGGFVLHDDPAPTERAARVRDAYRVFVTGLLSVTDTLVAGDVVGPAGVRRRDGDDPYLVVAADKGTARLSDTANSLADEHGFWLGDAFASGGSTGWDHKALGITAKGAWTAIARHFRELGIDIHTDEVSVVGVGDMSGDVFGNGLLTSPTLRLQAAFDHRDIFVDPDPDPAASYAERQRLFDLPTSSWQDYDRDVLSSGGFVASRAAKSVVLPPTVRDLLGVEDESLPPDELIREILRMKVDLLYAGGIGTVVRASTETFTGDHANDDIRITADRLNARVVGEGANLAITPRGRIEYARRGGRIDQDAIHNAGGVAISDREVNAKILFAPAIATGRLDRAERDAVLRAAADEVVADVCRDVDAQVWLLSRAHASSADDLAAHVRHLDRLEAAGIVDRTVDLLPSVDELEARGEAGAGLTRPELATLMAATKRLATEVMVDHDLTGTATAHPALAGAFATGIREHPAVDVRDHRLADEITALRIASSQVDRLGITHLHDVATVRDQPLNDVVAAHWLAQQVLDGDTWWPTLQDCADTVPDDTLEAAADRLIRLHRRVGLALLRDGAVTSGAIDATRDRQAAIADLVRDRWRDRGRGPVARRRMALLDDLVPDDLALDVALARHLGRVPDLAAVLDDPDATTVEAGVRLLARLDDGLHLAALDTAIARHLTSAPGSHDDWRRRHGDQLQDDVARIRRTLARRLLAGPRETADDPPREAARDQVAAAVRAVRADEALASDALASAVASLRHLVGED